MLFDEEALKAIITNAVKEAIKANPIKGESAIQKKSKNDTLLEEIDNWVPLKVAWKKMGISKNQWYSKYQHVIKHRTYASTTWVYLPSILKFFEEDAIN
ncbi:MAG: hypothetical protein ABIP51_06845 [Bacteroidia bacterium]